MSKRTNKKVLVKLEGVSKKYCRSLKRSLAYGVLDVTNDLFGRNNRSHQLRKNEFWAVNDISFELRRGECLGLIGPNGAGKSTLLKLLNGLIKPDAGVITMRGRVGALIELGAGFNPILTARENIFVNGAVLGFGKKETEKKFDSIIDFAEIEKFVDTPVQNFSSGMKVRLGFAIAAQMEPDILLIDEVLAVGDIGFRAKCFNAIRKIASTASVILVTHQMPEISRSCSSACLIADGENKIHSENVPEVISQYFDQFEAQSDMKVGGERATIHSVQVLNQENQNSIEISYLDTLEIQIEFEVSKSIFRPEIGLTVANQNLQNVLQCNTHFDQFKITNRGEKMKICLTLSDLNLNPGVYSISLGISDEALGEILVRWIDFCKLTVHGPFVGFAPIIKKGKWHAAP